MKLKIAYSRIGVHTLGSLAFLVYLPINVRMTAQCLITIPKNGIENLEDH